MCSAVRATNAQDDVQEDGVRPMEALIELIRHHTAAARTAAEEQAAAEQDSMVAAAEQRCLYLLGTFPGRVKTPKWSGNGCGLVRLGWDDLEPRPRHSYFRPVPGLKGARGALSIDLP